MSDLLSQINASNDKLSMSILLGELNKLKEKINGLERRNSQLTLVLKRKGVI